MKFQTAYWQRRRRHHGELALTQSKVAFWLYRCCTFQVELFRCNNPNPSSEFLRRPMFLDPLLQLLRYEGRLGRFSEASHGHCLDVRQSGLQSHALHECAFRIIRLALHVT